MKSEVKERWLEALRSGRYEQGRYQLRWGENFCCLGVLCDLVEPNKWEEEPGADAYRWDGSLGVLPTELRYEVDVSAAAESRLISFNDSNKNFTFIADWIERNL